MAQKGTWSRLVGTFSSVMLQWCVVRHWVGQREEAGAVLFPTTHRRRCETSLLRALEMASMVGREDRHSMPLPRKRPFGVISFLITSN